MLQGPVLQSSNRLCESVALKEHRKAVLLHTTSAYAYINVDVHFERLLRYV